MSKYVDGFVMVIPKSKEEEYKKMAEIGKDAWMKHGALEYYECQGESLAAKMMGDETPRTFPEMAGASADENVWFSFIVFESKAHRDEVNEKVEKEMGEMYSNMKDFEMPFETKKMAYGGFEVAVQGEK